VVSNDSKNGNDSDDANRGSPRSSRQSGSSLAAARCSVMKRCRGSRSEASYPHGGARGGSGGSTGDDSGNPHGGSDS
jgi:hypothetical protein